LYVSKSTKEIDNLIAEDQQRFDWEVGWEKDNAEPWYSFLFKTYNPVEATKGLATAVTFGMVGDFKDVKANEEKINPFTRENYYKGRWGK